MEKRNKTGGRVAGTPNKLTSELRERINDFLTINWNNLQADFESLEPKDKLLFYERLLQYGLPKLKTIEMTTINESESESDKLDLTKLSTETLIAISRELKAQNL